jgi:hypothetical protein
MRGLVVLVLVAALALAGCGGSDEQSGTSTTTGTTPVETLTETTTVETSEPTPDPQNLVADLSDLPTGYSIDRKNSGPRTLSEALREVTPEQAAVIKRERVDGYEVTFESPNLRVIACSATVYRSSEGAEEIFRMGVERIPEAARKEGETYERASIEESLGDETAAFNGKAQGASVFVVVWRDRNVIGLCGGGGLVATDPAETIRVARAQQGRISEALG